MSLSHSLLNTYPRLRATVPVLALADLPTPVEPLPMLGANAWIKRDDRTHPEYGGNKIRKLEFILADAGARRKDHIITFGAIGTNHGVATAMLCRQLGLRCSIHLFEQPPSATVTGNLKRMVHYGAELQYHGSLLNTVLAFYSDRRRWRRDSYFLFAGGSTPVGCLGFVNAALELRDQVRAGLCPAPARIFVPVGSAATLAGLTLGCALAQLDTEVVGVRVAPSHLGFIPTCTERTVSALMRETAQLLEARGVACPELPEPLLRNEYYGAGYGHETAAARKATARFAECHIALEQTYTAKAAAAFLEGLGTGSEPQLFWHTYNSRAAVFDERLVELPAELAALVA